MDLFQEVDSQNVAGPRRTAGGLGSGPLEFVKKGNLFLFVRIFYHSTSTESTWAIFFPSFNRSVCACVGG